MSSLNRLWVIWNAFSDFIRFKGTTNGPCSSGKEDTRVLCGKSSYTDCQTLSPLIKCL